MRELSEFDYTSIIKKRGRYRYNFKAMEYSLQASYDIFLEDFSNQASFSQIYTDLYNITFGIVETTEIWNTHPNIEPHEVAHEYATLLIERILEGRWRARVNQGEDKFSWVPYIKLNIRDTVYRKIKPPRSERHVTLDDISEVLKNSINCESDDHLTHPALIDLDAFHQTELETGKRQLADRCSAFLKLMYGDKYYILASKMLSLKTNDYSTIEDEELRLFTQTSLVLFKRLWESYDLSKVNHSSIDKVFNSSLYLASILASDQDKRLYVSLDLSNLYRLSLSYGGETLRVPTIDELEELISTAKVSYEILSSDLEDAQSLQKIRNKVRDDYSVSIRTDKLQSNVRHVFEYLSTGISDNTTNEGSDMISSLMTLSNRSNQIVDKILDKLERALEETEDNTELLKLYKEMLNNLNISMNLMTNIKMLMDSQKP